MNIKLLGLEFYKCRRRNITVLCAAVIAVELLWMGFTLSRQGTDDLRQGWMMMLYNLAMVDAIVLPLSVAALASRNCELEHKGNTPKLLETMVSPGSLYTAKLCWGALTLAVLFIVRSVVFAAMGAAAGFPGEVPLAQFCIFALISWAVSMMVYTLGQGLSLRFANQAPALICGISGSFLGILSMLFPPALIRFVPWGYYGLLALVGMDWNETTRITRFYWQWPSPADLALLAVWAAVFGTVGRMLFVKKEV